MGLLRVMLAISVFMAHSSGTGIPTAFIGFGGPSSVEIFFIISGIFIARILDKSYASVKNFYINRALRIYPIYFIVAVIVLFRSILIPELRDELYHYPLLALIIGAIANFTFFGSDWLMFLRLSDNNLSFGNFNDSDFPLWHMLLVPQSWSLGVEISFYLVAPFLCKISTKKLVIFAAFLFLVRGYFFIFGLNTDPWTYRFFPFELPLFIIGILLYRIKKHFIFMPKISNRHLYLVLVISYLSFSVTTNLFSLPRGIQFILITLLTCTVFLSSEENAIDRKIGDYSYPIYICHNLVITTYIGLVQISTNRFPIFELFQAPIIMVGITFSCVVLSSFLLLRIVKPLERVRDSHRK